MKKYLLALSLLGPLTLTGCYQKFLILQAEVVSMTKSDAQSSKALKVGEDVNEKWCMGDEPVLAQDNDLGLADQVIFKAQDGGKKADFITEAKIYRDTNGCALIVGKRAKI